MLHLRNWAFKASNVNLIRYNYYIHLKDHNKKINIKQNKLGYMKKSGIPQGVPVPPIYQSKLKKQNQEALQKKLFEQYKQKILTGKIDQQQQKQVDTLWGQDQKPQHYYQNFSYSQILTVSQPRRHDLKAQIEGVFAQFFRAPGTKLTEQEVLKEVSRSQDIEDLRKFVFCLDKSCIGNPEVWFKIEQKIKPKIYKLTTKGLLRLKYNINLISGSATPQFKKILVDILEQDIQNMSKQELMSYFYLLSWGKNKLRAQSQQKIIDCMQSKYYKHMTIDEKVNWLLVYTEFRTPMFAKPTQKKAINEERNHAKKLLHDMKLSNIQASELTIELCQKLLYCLTQLGINQTRAILIQLQNFLTQTNLEQLSPRNLYMIIYYSLHIDDGAGFLTSEFIAKLKQKALAAQNWSQLDSVHKLKVLHSLWGRDLWTDQMHDLYRQIEITSDSTNLYYFCQLERQFSTEREWQVLRCIAEIQYIPLPYYQAYYRFTKYMSICTEWDLKPILDKLQNTAPFYNPQRMQNGWLRRSKIFRDLKNYIYFGKGAMKYNIRPEFLNKSHFTFPLNIGLPINNSEFVMFADEVHQISIDFANDSDCIPGTQKLRPYCRQKMKFLEDIGWKHLIFHQKHTRQLNTWQKVAQVIAHMFKNRQQQAEVLQRQQWARAQEIKKMLDENEWAFLYGNEKQDQINNPQGLLEQKETEIQKLQRQKEEMQKK